ncbi:MFS transporter [Goodfellowiella coeruleoviolacea]|uniref:Major Facilitator Superfamily protein n=1 Tax=Goodfellowiella coeruleoviolacea TaxID=334858 RepID=A0AAE3GEM1_9PSEU|nr:MFS transporter [Goodfellowiella coeruleoviolacea]MCP2166323.1 Major Facilitator Superfamily protein [Goodfellowiella coeruleoviolacea]
MTDLRTASADSPTRTPSARPPARALPGPWLALLAAPVALGTTGPTVVLPRIAADLEIPVAAATWLGTAYGWGVAVGTPLLAGLLRLRGIRAALLLGAALVGAGTLLLVLAPTLPLLLAGRVVQALGAAGLITAAMNLAGSTRRMGLITAAISAAGAVGPLAGTLIGAAGTWRPVLALAALTLLAVPAALRVAPAAASAPVSEFDLPGAGLVLVLATALVLVPRAALPSAAVAVLAAVALARHVRRRPEGFVPLDVLRSRSFTGCCALALALATSYFAILYAVPRLLADRGWSAGSVGVGQLAVLLLGALLVWVLTSVRLARPVVLGVLTGLGVLALGLVLTPWPVPVLASAGVAVVSASGTQATLSVLAPAAVPDRHRPVAIGLFNLCYQLGGAFGPALVALLLA